MTTRGISVPMTTLAMSLFGVEGDDVAVQRVRDRGGGPVSVAVQNDVHVRRRASSQAVAHRAAHEVGADAALG